MAHVKGFCDSQIVRRAGGWAGAAEFKKAFEEAMATNEKLLQSDAEAAEKADEASAAVKEEAKKEAAAADEVTEALGNVAVKDE